ncbi:hypothetical protein DAPPUDRAFT_270363 [Daphnia pulex]|uniref:Uncharacterized protein n=1 Tax=Daphnia pulex TaxID=6669 RepID=E9I0L0_DAPPU|nr:hypothetical protein DAPPUDRAFT_270363 [Daphnia pulex]|eukprot:EFX62470.1 hypothetical protein DAPPUDRAFT_270363 [Daphnia pulex]
MKAERASPQEVFLLLHTIIKLMQLVIFFSIGSAEDAGSSRASGEAKAAASAVLAGLASWPFVAGLALMAGRIKLHQIQFKKNQKVKAEEVP